MNSHDDLLSQAWIGTIIALIFALLATGCESADKPQETPEDVVATSDLPPTTPDVVEPPPEEDGVEVNEEVTPAPNPKRVLLVDFDMRPPLSWRHAADHLSQLGFEVVYRRWFPHITGEDVGIDADTGEPAWRMIFVAAGGAPTEPTARMRLPDEGRLLTYVHNGGVLGLLPRSGWQDTPTSDGEWLHFNRILEGLEIPARIERNTAIGNVALPGDVKPPLHAPSAAGYPGTLEWTLDFPLALTPTDHPAFGPKASTFAAGYTPTLSCDGDDVALLAQTHHLIIQWWHHGTENNIAVPYANQPLSILARAGDNEGAVAIIPKSFFHLMEHSRDLADKPVLDLALLEGTGSALNQILDHLADYEDDPSVHSPQGCHEGNLPLFSAGANGVPLLGDGPVQFASTTVDTRAVGSTPPAPPEWAPPLTEEFPGDTEAEESTTPAWFTGGKALMAYGDWQPAPFMGETLAFWKSLGINGVVVTLDASVLPAFYAEDENAVGMLEHLSQSAESLNIQVFLGVHLISPYFGNEDVLDLAKGPYTPLWGGPAPMQDAWWDLSLKPMILGAAKAQKELPGIGGLSIDMELYGASSLSYHAGYAYDDGTWALIVDAIGGADSTLGEEANSQTVSYRLPWLIDHGLVPFAYKTLEEEVAARAKALRIEADAISPELDLALYMPMLSDDWFYRGLLKGWNDPDRPTTVLTYDLATKGFRDALEEQGIFTRVVSGMIGVLFSPENVGVGLSQCTLGSDGYWLFQYGDFPDSDDPGFIAGKHAPPAEYHEAVQSLNDSLSDATD